VLEGAAVDAPKPKPVDAGAAAVLEGAAVDAPKPKPVDAGPAAVLEGTAVDAPKPKPVDAGAAAVLEGAAVDAPKPKPVDAGAAAVLEGAAVDAPKPKPVDAGAAAVLEGAAVDAPKPKPVDAGAAAVLEGAAVDAPKPKPVDAGVAAAAGAADAPNPRPVDAGVVVDEDPNPDFEPNEGRADEVAPLPNVNEDPVDDGTVDVKLPPPPKLKDVPELDELVPGAVVGAAPKLNPGAPPPPEVDAPAPNADVPKLGNVEELDPNIPMMSFDTNVYFITQKLYRYDSIFELSHHVGLLIGGFIC
jgi:hypothetical protein